MTKKKNYSKKYFVTLAKQKGFSLSSDFTGLQNNLLIKCIKCSSLRSLITAKFLLDCDIQCKSCQKTNDFIESVNLVHKNKYDYSLTVFVNRNTNIKITCKKHGVFEQLPYKHKYGDGCIKCDNDEKKVKSKPVRKKAVKKTTKKKIVPKKSAPITAKGDFINKANVVHDNKYDYSRCNIKNKEVIIVCKNHGSFSETKTNHLSGIGCKKCVDMVTKKTAAWLDQLGIKIRNQTVWIRHGESVFVNGLDKKTKTIYEFYGDYWHGNPNVYNQDKECFPNKTFGDFYKRTIEREELIKKWGYSLVTIWESDYDSKQA